MRKARSFLACVMAGCRVCHGDQAVWFERNAMGVAARHHDATGHEVRVEQVIHTTCGGAEADDADRPGS